MVEPALLFSNLDTIHKQSSSLSINSSCKGITHILNHGAPKLENLKNLKFCMFYYFQGTCNMVPNTGLIIISFLNSKESFSHWLRTSSTVTTCCSQILIHRLISKPLRVQEFVRLTHNSREPSPA